MRKKRSWDYVLWRQWQYKYNFQRARTTSPVLAAVRVVMRELRLVK